MYIRKVINTIKHPWIFINYLNQTGMRVILPDKLVIQCCYRSEMGKKLNLKSPRTFNEKLQWLKLHDRNPYYCKLVDKYEAKHIIASIIGEQHIIPTYGVWDDVDQIDFQSLPNAFVLKTTHDSHSIIVCNQKKTLDMEKVKTVINNSLKNNYFYGGREWPYKNVKPRILAEKNMSDSDSGLVDYKIHCFNGKPVFILTCSNRYSQSGLIEVFYDLNWNKLPVRRPGNDIEGIDIPRPDNLGEMIQMAAKLSAGIPFVRIDFYSVNNAVFFGEMTFFPASGYKKFIPEEYDEYFGSLIDLKSKSTVRFESGQ